MRSRSRSLRGRSGFDPATGPACRSASRRSNPAPEPFAKRLVRTWHCDYAARTSQSHFFSAIAGVGTSHEVNVQALREQLFFPADVGSRTVLFTPTGG